jgi:hypothetical protein
MRRDLRESPPYEVGTDEWAADICRRIYQLCLLRAIRRLFPATPQEEPS